MQPGTREGMNMEQADNLLGRIRKNYHSFSKGQKRLADYITENYDKADKASITFMATTAPQIPENP